MSRLLSVSLTEAQVLARTKTVTRRLGWRFLSVGDHLTLVRKSMGRKRPNGSVEPLIRLAEVEVVEVRREALCAITSDDVVREGFPEWENDPALFVDFFCESMGCARDTEVTVITWRYLTDDEVRDA
jgi:hypothetical protein